MARRLSLVLSLFSPQYFHLFAYTRSFKIYCLVPCLISSLAIKTQVPQGSEDCVLGCQFSKRQKTHFSQENDLSRQHLVVGSWPSDGKDLEMVSTALPSKVVSMTTTSCDRLYMGIVV